MPASFKSAAFQYNVKARFFKNTVISLTSLNGSALSLVQETRVFDIEKDNPPEKNSSSSITLRTKVYSSRNRRIIVHSCSLSRSDFSDRTARGESLEPTGFSNGSTSLESWL